MPLDRAKSPRAHYRPLATADSADDHDKLGPGSGSPHGPGARHPSFQQLDADDDNADDAHEFESQRAILTEEDVCGILELCFA